jgi:tetraacyldisaccharide 4'-kinase
MREPAFWWERPGLAARLLAPLSVCYGAVAARRLEQRGTRVPVPVICVGNLTAGGAGKTPMALAVANLIQSGERPFFLTRGYGGRLKGPVLVNAGHDAADVGDEPLLLARIAPTVVAVDRVAGARTAVAAGATVVVMDDGFQNPSLTKDLSLLVIDGRRGIGNGFVIPAGPLRAPLAAQIQRTDALVIVGAEGESARTVIALASARGVPILHATLAPRADVVAALAGRPVVAFAGIGSPDKFFATLRDAGIAVAKTRHFPDHHPYDASEARSLLAQADRENLRLVTTEKDLARMRGDTALTALAAATTALPVTLMFDDARAIRDLVTRGLARSRPNGL